MVAPGKYRIKNAAAGTGFDMAWEPERNRLIHGWAVHTGTNQQVCDASPNPSIGITNESLTVARGSRRQVVLPQECRVRPVRGCQRRCGWSPVAWIHPAYAMEN